MNQNRQSITEVERLIQLNKINNLIQQKKEFNCIAYNSKGEEMEVTFYPLNVIRVNELYMVYAHYNNFILALKPINGIICKLKLKLENLVVCQ
jgi:hypothetical protein